MQAPQFAMQNDKTSKKDDNTFLLSQMGGNLANFGMNTRGINLNLLNA